nr:nucleotidyltransferase family protein [uncultured Caldimonas sp.]
MNGWEKTLIGPHITLRAALETINQAGAQIALVVDEHRRLLGTLSDGDVRRALLKGQSLQDEVQSAMHRQPTCARLGDDRQAILGKMRRLGLHQVPLLDTSGVVLGLQTVDDYLALPQRENWVVIMAGGLGTRLESLTRDTPKPMLKVGPKPLLETIVGSYAEQGFTKFYFAVNYKAEQIERHFGDGSQFGVEIRYLREKQRMGTAGALSLLPESPDMPIVVTNADLLTKEDYGRMVDLHVASGAHGTMGVRTYELQVPFGVVVENNGQITSIEEKPVQTHLVSAGMYVLSPEVLRLVPPSEFFDMPTLFTEMIARGMRARTHSVDGYWLDIGRISDYERANHDFGQVFR